MESLVDHQEGLLVGSLCELLWDSRQVIVVGGGLGMTLLLESLVLDGLGDRCP